MEMKINRTKTILFMIAICISSVAVMADMVIVPSIANLYQVFGDNINLVNYIVSGPALLMVVTSLLAAKLMQKFSKKSLIIVSFIIFAIGSIGGILIENAVYMAVMRSLVGAAMGVIGVCAMALLSEIFVKEEQRSFMMGIYNAAMAGVGALLGIISGIFAAQAWQSVFKVYWISVPIVVLLALWLPQTPAEQEIQGEEETKGSLFTFDFNMLAITFFVFNIVYCIVYFQIAVYVAETAIGNEATAGLLSALGTVGSAVCCASFGFIYNKLKHISLVIAYGVMGICFALLYLQPSLPVAIVACTLMGGAYGTGLSCCLMESTVVVTPSRISTAISIITAVMGVGMFASTYFVTILKNLLKTDMLYGIMPVLIGVCVIFALIEIRISVRRKKQTINEVS